jgi:hypothetical protein
VVKSVVQHSSRTDHHPNDRNTSARWGPRLEEATKEVTGDFKHRGAAMQEARFVIDDIAPNHSKYNHRLMDYNNDPTTTWAGVQKFFKLLEARVLGEKQ